MDFENKQDERGDWREERRRWREERHKRREERAEHYRERWMVRYHSGRGGNVWTGIFLLIIGGVALLKAILFPLPAWVFTWQMLLIAMGFFLGVRHGFRGAAWFILMLVGGVFLINEFFPELMLRQFLWPAALIVLGLFIIFRPRRHRYWREHALLRAQGVEAIGAIYDQVSRSYKHRSDNHRSRTDGARLESESAI